MALSPNVIQAGGTRIPAVPVRTPMFDRATGKLSRTWVIFFEQLGGGVPGIGGVPASYIRTLLIKTCVAGSDIADHVTVYAEGTAQRVVGVLRKAIAADLVVRLNLIHAGVSAPLIVCTIPLATAVSVPIVFTGFVAAPPAFADGDVLTADVLASDSSADPAGIAAFTLQWQ